MKKLWPFIIIAAVVVGLGTYFKLQNDAPVDSPSQETASGTTTDAATAGSDAVGRISTAAAINTQAPTDLASRASSPNPTPDSTITTNEEALLPPLTVLDKARVVIHNYRAAFGENPVGTNPEITAALMGKNPKQINFVAESGLQVNENGELLDGYGTPFFFHQVSGKEMEIHSAGADKVMWTGDDLVTR